MYAVVVIVPPQYRRAVFPATMAAMPDTQPNPPLTELPWQRGYLTAAAASERNAVVLGAGIAGCCSARALAERGYQVTVVDRHATPAEAGSGNLQAVVYPKLSLRQDQLPEINLAALRYASRYYQSHWQAGRGEQCGVLVLAEGAGQADELAAIADRHRGADWIELLDNTALSGAAGLALNAANGLWFKQLGWVQPQAVCRALLDHPAIDYCQAEVDTLSRSGQQWQLIADGRLVAAANQCVIASGVDSARFSQTGELPFKPIRGQVSHLVAAELTATPRAVVCAKGYLAPPRDGVLTLGASYRRDVQGTQLNADEHRHNLDQLSASDRGLEQLLAGVAAANLGGRANFRATTPDYLPLAGPVPDCPAMLERYAFLGRDAKTIKPLEGAYHPQLFMLAGLGSRGFSYAPLLAELLAAQMSGAPAPLPATLCKALHPARFVIRDLKRNRLAGYPTVKSSAHLG